MENLYSCLPPEEFPAAPPEKSIAAWMTTNARSEAVMPFPTTWASSLTFPIDAPLVLTQLSSKASCVADCSLKEHRSLLSRCEALTTTGQPPKRRWPRSAQTILLPARWLFGMSTCYERSWSEPIGLMCRTVRKFIAVRTLLMLNRHCLGGWYRSAILGAKTGVSL